MKKKFIAMFLLFTFATFIFTNASVKAESLYDFLQTTDDRRKTQVVKYNF